MMAVQTAVLILAAGASSRMGRPKQVLPWKGTTLLGHAIKQVKAFSSDITVVLGANAKAIKKSLDAEIDVVVNPFWKEGLGSSIAFGTKSKLERNQPDNILMVLADQPLIDIEHFEKLLATLNHNPAKVIATAYGKRKGVPAVFPQFFFKDLIALGGDNGAKQLMEKYGEGVLAIPSKRKTIDIDTPEIYEKLYLKYGSP